MLVTDPKVYNTLSGLKIYGSAHIHNTSGTKCISLRIYWHFYTANCCFFVFSCLFHRSVVSLPFHTQCWDNAFPAHWACLLSSTDRMLRATLSSCWKYVQQLWTTLAGLSLTALFGPEAEVRVSLKRQQELSDDIKPLWHRLSTFTSPRYYEQKRFSRQLS